ncbi:hypothetical protein [Bradyrhizobium iriomotense]|uniref:Lipoprotein n=1 Tax=Bradyrhizobium iriomotense TaxID=441950 RepID=A0ABQ6BFP8_9BRAD|nr:hypothetical protein [Bradyrhizobium iriomotense]GLR90992.1 hypothetical protein GCM10007857_77080 [Bradyrhizobium iriomotense]
MRKHAHEQSELPRKSSAFACLASAALAGLSLVTPAFGEGYRPPVVELEDYERVPLPTGFGVQQTDADGPVFTDARGMTLYSWPLELQRNGNAGEAPGRPGCDNTRYTVNEKLEGGPAGFILPEVDTRPSCIDLWPPVYADENAKPVGSFTVLARNDGRKQWAYNGYALYTSILDKKPGQVNGGASRTYYLTAHHSVPRKPVGPPPNVPPAFLVRTVATGRIILTRDGSSVYTFDRDGPGKSNCADACLAEWTPISAGSLTLPQGEWGVIERSPGVRQWTFRGEPLYTHNLDRRPGGLEGSDVPGWHNAYTQKNPDPPEEFTVQDTSIGQVLADRNGKTLYVYNCGESTPDQLACDHPTTTQVYRLTICGNFDATRCNRTWRYVPAPANAASRSLIWRAAWIDAETGRFVDEHASNALHIWTFRDRPIYTFALDARPGETRGDAWGEDHGARNGFVAFWLRDDFWGGAK